MAHNLTARDALAIARGFGFTMRFDGADIRSWLEQARECHLIARMDGRKLTAMDYFVGYAHETARVARCETLEAMAMDD